MNVSDEKIYTVFNYQNNDCKCWYDEDYDSESDEENVWF